MLTCSFNIVKTIDFFTKVVYTWGDLLRASADSPSQQKYFFHPTTLPQSLSGHQVNIGGEK
jgi:hypothetical protein